MHTTHKPTQTEKNMIYLIITACVLNRYGVVDAESRRQRYTECISATLRMLAAEGFSDNDIRPIIVENSGDKEAVWFLWELRCADVLLTNNNNDAAPPHKAFNELRDIKQVIDAFHIQDDDIVIKLTGRYKPLSSSFFSLVARNAHTHHAFIKFFNVCTGAYDDTDCVLGLFAIQCKFLREFEYTYPFPHGLSPEQQFASFVRDRVDPAKIVQVGKDGQTRLHLECCFGDDLRMCVV